MPSNERLYSKVPAHVNKDKSSGVNKDSGPYIGIVKNNVDPTRSGRLRVFIPDFGGSELEESQWITVSYASPYMGATRWPRSRTEKCEGNEYAKVNHSYGMWFVPPDVGNNVLLTFVSGDVNKGYWFACVMPELTHYGMPGGAGSMFDTRETTKHADLIGDLPKPPYPVTEFNEVNKKLWPKWSEFLTIPKPIHEARALRLLREGLEDDKIRGVITSSSQRESPSRVFGISTPGPQKPGPPMTGKSTSPDHDLAEPPGAMPDLNDVDGPQYRLGGHTFVMDDGDEEGKNRLIRFRTSSGHQIMMNDTHGFIYVANAEGTAWFEMTKEGKFYFYAADSISFRTQNDFNVHADNDINMFAGKASNLYAVTDIVQETGGLFSLRAEGELNMFGNMVGIKSASKIVTQSDTFTSMKVGTELGISAGGTITVKAGANINTESGANTTHLVGGQYIESAAKIHMNGPAAPSVREAKAFKKPAPLDRALHLDPEPIGHHPKWKPMEIKFQSSVPIVPTHEPYNYPCDAPKRPICCVGTGGTVEEGHPRPHCQQPKKTGLLGNEGPIPRLKDISL